ncbi:hypothetical protein [Pseudomonas putida]|uniref:hypothetical protein n=1 Tax=Pseudomonas putida TaxID=303 RepID=UPI00157573A1|nr:hypothetical protein [Pseudomonas putida]NTY90426.1 hypothetical protein [Pseudomonas putida]NTY98968.1 hypothetical protein [Pseudomonas putida]NTZ21251.1 hypothetical protein [Pseudomonas putida]NTZ53230.1 hypothetical protein [Pseudomonas putida]NTZ65120.1 hypothetical protein [Pseudomonas putida]
MNLADIKPAIESVTASLIVTDLRELTYLATYPGMISIGAAGEVANDVKFHQLSTLVYGCMPRIARIDPSHTSAAVTALGEALSASEVNYKLVRIKSISDCLHSVVGASKLLHFANPNVFPIWDSNIEAFRKISDSDITSVSKYMDYIDEIHGIRREAEFPEFYTKFSGAYSARLTANAIPAYSISHIRAIEAAAFELAR